MGTSKGHVFTPKDYLKIADPIIYRIMILKTNPMKHITFRIEELPQYYDYYQRMEDFFFDLETTEDPEESRFINYIFPLIQINNVPKSKVNRLPLKLLIFLTQIQNILSIDSIYEKAKHYMENNNFSSIITKKDFKALIDQTDNWILEVKKILKSEENPKIRNEIKRKLELFTIPEEVDEKILGTMDHKQIKGISLLKDYIEQNESLEADSIQNKIFSMAKDELDLPPRKFFEAIYQIILGKKSGPRLGPFLSLLDKNWLLERLDIKIKY